MLHNVPSTSQATGISVPTYQSIESDKARSSYNRICTECANQPSAIKQLILRVVMIHNASVCEEHKISSLHSDDLSEFSNQYPQLAATIKKLVDASDKMDTNFNKLAFILGEYTLLTKLLEKPVVVDKKTQTTFFQKFFIKHGTDLAVAKLCQLVISERDLSRNAMFTVLNESALTRFEQALDAVNLEPLNPECTQSGYIDSHYLFYSVIPTLPHDKIHSFYNGLGFGYEEIKASLNSHSCNYENINIELLSKFLCNGNGRDWNNERIIQALYRAELGLLASNFEHHLYTDKH